MYIYNITCKIDEKILLQYSNWLNKEHIPALMATKCFTQYKIFLMHDDECNTITDTLIIQYFCNSLQDYNSYINDFSKELKSKSIELWGDKVLIFSTLLKQID